MKEGKYLIAKDIPLDRRGEKVIKKGIELFYIHGGFYLGNNLVGQDYQEDFRHLLDLETRTGWNYLVPVKTRVGESII